MYLCVLEKMTTLRAWYLVLVAAIQGLELNVRLCQDFNTDLCDLLIRHSSHSFPTLQGG